jgi:hypothetical protein
MDHHLGQQANTRDAVDSNDEYFVGERIRLVAGNSIIARGAFGEISLAVMCCSASDTNDDKQQQQLQSQQH